MDPDDNKEDAETAWVTIYIDSQNQPSISTPLTYKQAVNHPVYSNDWKKAIAAEIIALILNGI